MAEHVGLWPVSAPWRQAGPTAGIDDLFIEDREGIVIARIGRDMTPARREALRVFLLAAPDLYEALEELVSYGLDEDQLAYLIEQKSVVKARAALLKANPQRKPR